MTGHNQETSYLCTAVAERSSTAADKLHPDQSDADQAVQIVTVQAGESGAVQTIHSEVSNKQY